MLKYRRKSLKREAEKKNPTHNAANTRNSGLKNGWGWENDGTGCLSLCTYVGVGKIFRYRCLGKVPFLLTSESVSCAVGIDIERTSLSIVQILMIRGLIGLVLLAPGTFTTPEPAECSDSY